MVNVGKIGSYIVSDESLDVSIAVDQSTDWKEYSRKSARIKI